jgi:RNA polymerase sigma-70 factor (ECF subfamily)
MSRDDLEKMIERQVPRLRRFARALLRDAEEADDLVQNCLDTAWRRAQQWRPETDLRVWLFSILHNLNANMRQGTLRPADSGSTTEGSRDTGSLGQDNNLDLSAIQQGLAQLAQDHHEVLLLVCLEEMTYEQVADILGIPVGTVIARLHRTREHLRRSMNKEQGPSLRRVK